MAVLCAKHGDGDRRGANAGPATQRCRCVDQIIERNVLAPESLRKGADQEAAAAGANEPGGRAPALQHAAFHPQQLRCQQLELPQPPRLR